MRPFLARLGAWLRRPDLAALAGPIPLATGSLLGQEWLAPHLVRLPSIARDARRTRDA